MDSKTLLYEGIAEEILLMLKPYRETTLIYLHQPYLEKGDTTLENIPTQAGKAVMEKIVKILKNNLESEQ